MPLISMNCDLDASSFGARYTRFVLACACKQQRALSLLCTTCSTPCLRSSCSSHDSAYELDQTRLCLCCLSISVCSRYKQRLTLLGELTASRCQAMPTPDTLPPRSNSPIPVVRDPFLGFPYSASSRHLAICSSSVDDSHRDPLAKRHTQLPQFSRSRPDDARRDCILHRQREGPRIAKPYRMLHAQGICSHV